ncbi:META domain-containing protein [Pedobacter glucosidilyticus]|uniref:META domain-containing protein n=1 Tax=Pedobacter glucosidilyticus TaxID=1122941 RepID=UPI0026F19672|nr:META domain-containing protein [Pedobacter glucosidilyticus]
MKKLFAIFSGAVLLLSCASQKNFKSQPLYGHYLGELPCADCSGMRTYIQLFPDFTYHKKTIYLDKADEVYTVKDSWKIVNDSVLVLNEQNNQQAYLYKKDKLTMLSQKREIITGNLAYRYNLFKITDDSTYKADFSNLKKNQVNFLGQGNEPFWSVEILSNQSLKLKQLGEEDIIFKIFESNYKKDVSIFKAKNNAASITFKIYNFPCINDMSGAQADKYVELIEPNKILKGCGYILQEDFELAGKWHLSYMKDETIKQVAQEKLLFINFQTESKQLNGNLGCNNFGATYSINNHSIKIEKIISTMMACPALTIEQKFSEALQKTNHFMLVDGKLNFFNGQSLLLSFTR